MEDRDVAVINYVKSLTESVKRHPNKWSVREDTFGTSYYRKYFWCPLFLLARVSFNDSIAVYSSFGEIRFEWYRTKCKEAYALANALFELKKAKRPKDTTTYL
jgi:hypothetical protein